MCTSEVKGSSRSNVFFQGGASSLGGHSVKVCSFLPSVVSCGEICSSRFLFKAQFDVVPIFGSVYAI